MALRDRVEAFISGQTAPGNLGDLLDECAKDGSVEGLACVTRLFEDMYGGITFNVELKAPAAWELVTWGTQGLDGLVDASLKNPTPKNKWLCAEVLSAVASRALQELKPVFYSESRWLKLSSYLAKNQNVVTYARSKLVELVLSLNDDDEVIELAASGLSSAHFSHSSVQMAKEIFSAISTRWLSTGEPILKTYEHMLTRSSDDEPAFQAFFTAHPQLLDPLAADIWPRPNLHGARIPDFVVRRFDDSYVVVEIETPSKQLVTEANQLSAWATHAIAQVAEYQRFLERLPSAQSHFPAIDNVDGLVVVGMEAALTPGKKQALRNDNRQRHAMKIVGFDWLLRKAQSVRSNLIRNGVEIRHARVV